MYKPRKYVWPTGDAASITCAQRTSLDRLYDRLFVDELAPVDVEISPLLGGGGCVMFQHDGVWYGVETDGHTHT
jgi:hypothetical protein